MSQDEKYCSACGVVINAKAEICPKCGVRQMAAPFSLGGSAPNGKSKIVAGILGIFFGGIGVQHFYLGSIGLGILSGNNTKAGGIVIAPSVGVGNILSDNNGNKVLNGVLNNSLNGTLSGILNGNALGILGGSDCGCKSRKH